MSSPAGLSPAGHALLRSESAFLGEILAAREVVESGLGAVLMEDETRKILVPLDGAIRLSEGLVEQLTAPDVSSLGAVLEWLGSLLHAHGEYAEHYHLVVQPVLANKGEEVTAWLAGEGPVGGATRPLRSVGALLDCLGQPVARVARWRFLACSGRPACAVEQRQVEAFLCAADEHLRVLFEKILVWQNEGRVAELAEILPKGLLAASGVRASPNLLYHSGELVKEFTRGKHIRSFYLFSDFLLHFKLVHGQKGHATVKSLKPSKNVLPLSSIEGVEPYERAGLSGFRIDRKGKKSMVLVSDTAHERDHWVRMLRDVVQLHACGRGGQALQGEESDLVASRCLVHSMALDPGESFGLDSRRTDSNPPTDTDERGTVGDPANTLSDGQGGAHLSHTPSVDS